MLLHVYRVLRQYSEVDHRFILLLLWLKLCINTGQNACVARVPREHSTESKAWGFWALGKLIVSLAWELGPWPNSLSNPKPFIRHDLFCPRGKIPWPRDLWYPVVLFTQLWPWACMGNNGCLVVLRTYIAIISTIVSEFWLTTLLYSFGGWSICMCGGILESWKFNSNLKCIIHFTCRSRNSTPTLQQHIMFIRKE